MKVLARAALGLLLLGGVAVVQPVVVSAQGGAREIAHLCQDPEFRQFLSEVFFEGQVPVNSVGACVSVILTVFANQTDSSRIITLLCQTPAALAEFGNQGRCVAALNAEFKH